MVVVVIARGLMRTPVYSENKFHGARTSDIEDVVMMLRGKVAPSWDGPGSLPLFATGFSMGGIVISNYLARSGVNCELMGAVSISGCANANINSKFEYSRRVWQPLVAYELKKQFILPDLSHLRTVDRIDADHILSNCSSIYDFDCHMVAPYHKYRDVTHYYNDMSFCCEQKWKGVARPLIVLQARDDPLVDIDSFPIGVTHFNKDIIYVITEGMNFLPLIHGVDCSFVFLILKS